MQVAAVWLEVFSLFLVFFYSFDLSYSFILGKLSFLITQGVATTLYISAILIAISSFYTSFFRGQPCGKANRIAPKEHIRVS